MVNTGGSGVDSSEELVDDAHRRGRREGVRGARDSAANSAVGTSDEAWKPRVSALRVYRLISQNTLVQTCASSTGQPTK
jgi:hypothetical protein